MNQVLRVTLPNLQPKGNARTSVRVDTHYMPRNPLYSVMNAVMMRTRFAAVVDSLLGGLKALSEERTPTLS